MCIRDRIKYNSLLAQFNTTTFSDFKEFDNAHDKIWSVAQLSNDILIGSEGGISKYSQESGFQDYPQFSDVRVSMIKVQEDIIWIGTWDNGLIQWNSKTGKQKRFTHQVSDTTTLISNTIRSIAIDKMGTLWVGTPKGLNRYSPKDNSFKHYLFHNTKGCLLYTSPSPRDATLSRMPSSA